MAAASGALMRLGVRPSAAAAAAGQASIEVDAREAARRILKARLTLPAAPGPFAFVYPKWLPGEHAPVGPINDVVGLAVTVAGGGGAGGKPVAWQRDDEDMYQFRCELPAGTRAVVVTLDYVTSAGGRGANSPAVATPELLILKWNHVLVYPKGADPRALGFAASVRLPAGWSHASALTVARKSGDSVSFQPVSLETLIDSPLAAGAHTRAVDLTSAGGPPHTLHLTADSEEALAIKPPAQAAFTRLCSEAGALFGGWPYRRYHFLLTLSDFVPHGGLEHHESSDNRLPERTLIDDNQWTARTGLLPHELAHAWNGKFRRPAGLATPDYQQPMKTDLLWVYEGLTTYLGETLAARSGLRSAADAREALAVTAAVQDLRSGRAWRPLSDTARAAPVLSGAGREWRSWRRGLDYYPESQLIWLEADVTIRQRTQGRRSLDDFCQRFYRAPREVPAVSPFTLDDVLGALNEVCAMDWKAFFQARVYTATGRAPLGGIVEAGWRLGYRDTPSGYLRSVEQASKEIDHTYSLGLVLREDGGIIDVTQGAPAARAGVAPATRLVAVNGRKFTRDALKAAIAATAPGGKGPGARADVELLVESSDFFRTHKVAWKGGLRYPTLERDASRPDLLSAIFNARVGTPARAAAP
jgi:predicted metalloprotease with PDZ domain